jgi:hypothetical protein
VAGVPWELGELPRQVRLNPEGNIFGSPPPSHRQRIPKPKDHLDTIAERSRGVSKTVVPESESQEEVEGPLNSEDVAVEDNVSPKKVRKDQVSSLTKMLSALRR